MSVVPSSRSWGLPAVGAEACRGWLECGASLADSLCSGGRAVGGDVVVCGWAPATGRDSGVPLGAVGEGKGFRFILASPTIACAAWEQEDKAREKGRCSAEAVGVAYDVDTEHRDEAKPPYEVSGGEAARRQHDSSRRLGTTNTEAGKPSTPLLPGAEMCTLGVAW